jgi:hypothetical protein
MCQGTYAKSFVFNSELVYDMYLLIQGSPLSEQPLC